MLEVKELTKRYKPKKGVPVVAVDHINLKFPETGMVFLLGKSGSGKSTMLNLLGGLDVYDEGEIIICGKSSKNFKQKDFDSYRNTYLGFIFQEYNILEEFNVGANIALALQLQGIKPEDETINAILKKVDLEGFGLRKPNELSGGQKQRVAIARALVKDPKIIMADEPTGALDSTTGRQVLDTLKKLSEDKLVIVVSHDREFAEKYADRIIELADGHVISDMEYFGEETANTEAFGAEDTLEEGNEETKAELIFEENEVILPAAYHLTEEDRLAINAWLDGQKDVAKLRMAKNSNSRRKRATDENRIAQYSGDDFHLIKSKLPMKNAFKIGASGLKHKKFRLVITILLSFVAFALFGLADTMGSYNHIRTCSNSISDSKIPNATFNKQVKRGTGLASYWSAVGFMSQEDLNKIKKDTGIDVTGVYYPKAGDLSIYGQYNAEAKFTETEYHIYAPDFSGFAEFTEKTLKDTGFTLLAGRLADGSKNEIVISEYFAQTFIIGGYRAVEDLSNDQYQTITKPEEMVGKSLNLNGSNYEIVGVVDTHFDLDRYVPLTKQDVTDTNMDAIVDYALMNELSYVKRTSWIQMAMVGEGCIARMIENASGIEAVNGYLEFYNPVPENDNAYAYAPAYEYELSQVDREQIVWFDEEKTTLAKNELIVSESTLLGLASIFTAETEGYPYPDVEEAIERVKEMHNVAVAYYSFDEDTLDNWLDIKVVGYIPASFDDRDFIIPCDAIFAKTTAANANYTYAIGTMPETYAKLKELVTYAFEGDGETRYYLVNSVTVELDGLDEVFKILSRVFLWVGLFFAVFASVMMATFISSSISYKKQEIGILRAIGARGSDVFRIFASESFVIAMINFVLSTLATFGVTMWINHVLRYRVGIMVTILNFGIRQIALLLVISLLVAALASFFPVNHNARKRPIDAIRNR